VKHLLNKIFKLRLVINAFAEKKSLAKLLLNTNPIYVRFQVLTAASMKIRTFWDIAPCGLVVVDRRFRSVYCLHHQDDDRPDDGGSTHL
jgi:hypothetical protein